MENLDHHYYEPEVHEVVKQFPCWPRKVITRIVSGVVQPPDTELQEFFESTKEWFEEDL